MPPIDGLLSTRSMTSSRVEARLEIDERAVDQGGTTPAALHARMAEAVVMRAPQGGSREHRENRVICTLHTEVVHLHPGGPVELVAHRVEAGPGGQLWTVEATTPHGHLIAHSRVRLVRAADMAAERQPQTPSM